MNTEATEGTQVQAGAAAGLQGPQEGVGGAQVVSVGEQQRHVHSDARGDGTWRADASPPLADAVARDLGRDLYVTLEDGEYDALDACAAAGFAVHRRKSYYRIPTDPAVTGLAGAVLPAGLDVLSAADAEITRLRLLDDALRQDVPGSAGWR
jgi:hypothetical protein